MEEEIKTKWIYIVKSNENIFNLICLALASVVKEYEEKFHIVKANGISKYFHGLKNVEIGSPMKDRSEIFYLKIPEYLNFCEICEEIETQLNFPIKKKITPYTGFIKPNKSIMRLIEDKKNIVVFSYFSIINEMTFDFKNLGDLLYKEGYFPICIGSRNEKLIKGTFDLRELADIDEILKIRNKISFIITSNPFVKDIALLFGLKVILLNSNIITVYQSRMNYEIRTVRRGLESELMDTIGFDNSDYENVSTEEDKFVEKKFEVPYNFDECIIEYYKKRKNYISHLFLPPFKDDLINTRTVIESRVKGLIYMPPSRDEYEHHLSFIKSNGLDFVVLWQDVTDIISKEFLNYYVGLGASGFIIANDKNAKNIKEYNRNLKVIASIVQANLHDITNKDLSYYDYVVLFYPFTRSLESIKALQSIKDKLILMPNTFCHTHCLGKHHWFAKDRNLFKIERDCPAYKDIDHSTFILPEHLELFDSFVGMYKLQGREYSTDEIITVCESYFRRVTLPFLMNDNFHKQIKKNQKDLGLSQYYNIETI